MDSDCFVIDEAHETVLEFFLSSGVQIDHSCGGNGTCGTCRIIVENFEDSVPERNEVEREMAEDRGLAPNERLSCQLPARAGMRVRVPRPT
jgi:ferredoxin, 2Fe-2S